MALSDIGTLAYLLFRLPDHSGVRAFNPIVTFNIPSLLMQYFIF